jgi:quercetin dioxygenase-like cupin family protein
MAEGRSFAVVESAPPAGAPGPPPHIHDDYDEAWYVLEGAIEFRIGDRVEQCGPGSLAFAPRGTVHGFRNPGPGDARMLVVMTAEEVVPLAVDFRWRSGHAAVSV